MIDGCVKSSEIDGECVTPINLDGPIGDTSVII